MKKTGEIGLNAMSILGLSCTVLNEDFIEYDVMIFNLKFLAQVSINIIA